MPGFIGIINALRSKMLNKIQCHRTYTFHINQLEQKESIEQS